MIDGVEVKRLKPIRDDRGELCEILRSDDPLLLTTRDAAWDAKRLWLPTVAGLYELDRATGEMRCLAHKDDTPVYTVLKDGGWLYLGAKDGIYRYRIR